MFKTYFCSCRFNNNFILDSGSGRLPNPTSGNNKIKNFNNEEDDGEFQNSKRDYREWEG